MVAQHYAVNPRKIGQRVDVRIERIKKLCAETVSL